MSPAKATCNECHIRVNAGTYYDCVFGGLCVRRIVPVTREVVKGEYFGIATWDKAQKKSWWVGGLDCYP